MLCFHCVVHCMYALMYLNEGWVWVCVHCMHCMCGVDLCLQGDAAHGPSPHLLRHCSPHPRKAPSRGLCAVCKDRLEDWLSFLLRFIVCVWHNVSHLSLRELRFLSKMDKIRCEPLELAKLARMFLSWSVSSIHQVDGADQGRTILASFVHPSAHPCIVHSYRWSWECRVKAFCQVSIVGGRLLYYARKLPWCRWLTSRNPRQFCSLKPRIHYTPLCRPCWKVPTFPLWDISQISCSASKRHAHGLCSRWTFNILAHLSIQWCNSATMKKKPHTKLASHWRPQACSLHNGVIYATVSISI